MSGTRTDLAKVDRSNISLIVDLASVFERGKHKFTYKETFPGSVADNAITIENRYPSQIELEIELLTQKDVPVQINYSGNVPANYFADKENAHLSTPVIRVEGPDPVVQKIAKAVIEVDLEGRSDSFSEDYRYTLCDAEGNPVDADQITTEVSEVKLGLTVQPYKEIALTFNIKPGGGATEETSIIEYEPKTVAIAVPPDKLAEVADSIELGVIDLSTLEEDTVMEFPIPLPAGATNLSKLDTVTVSVQFPDLKIAEFMAANFKAINVPEGMEGEIVNRVLTVKVRGPQELVDKMTSEDITIVVDFAQAQPGGAFTVKADVEIAPEFAQVGAMGTYQVSAKLLEVEQEEQQN